MASLKYLTSEQKKFWDENGFIKLTNVFSQEEIEEMTLAYDDIFARRQREMDDIDGSIVREIHALQMHSAVFTRGLLHPKLLDAVEDMMDTKNIVLHDNKAVRKIPNKDIPCPTHQDHEHFAFKKHSLIAIFIHLDDTTNEDGALAVYPGSHKLGPLQHSYTKHDATGVELPYVDPEKYTLSRATTLPSKKGDVLIYSYMLIHGCHLATADKPIRIVLFHMNAADDEPVDGVDHQFACNGLVLRGRNVKRDAKMNNRFVQ